MLGTCLFERQAQGLRLTQAHRAYLQELSPILDALDASTRRASASRCAGWLRILSTPGFAARWLLPRLHRFGERDQIDISVSQGAPCMDFSHNHADVVIHWGEATVDGAVVEPMMESGRYPVSSTALVEREGLETPRDLLGATLLHDEVDDGWGEWFSKAGVTPNGLPRGPRLANCELTLTAAEQEQGVALAYDAVARNTLEAGRLGAIVRYRNSRPDDLFLRFRGHQAALSGHRTVPQLAI